MPIVHYDSCTAYLEKTSNGIVFNNKTNLSPVNNYTNVELQSMEFVVSFTNVRKDNKSNIFSFIINNQTYVTVTIVENQYFKIEDLITEINAKIITALALTPQYTVVLTVNPLNPLTLYFVLSLNIQMFKVIPGIMMSNILNFKAFLNS